MSTPNLNVLLSSAIATYDNQSPNTPLLSNINPGSLSFGAQANLYNEYFQALTTGSPLTLPLPTCFVWYVRNKAATGSVLVTATYLVISGVQQCFLGPGDIALWFDSSKSSGLTALALTGIITTIPCEVYVAG